MDLLRTIAPSDSLPARRRRFGATRRFAFPLVGAAMLVPGCAPSCAPAGPAPTATATVTSVTDGDTLKVRMPDGAAETIRLSGIDAPEMDTCVGPAAKAQLMAIVPVGTAVTLTSDGRDDRDRYGRLLRYVDAGATDTGREMIGGGLAVARYDSRDGYGRHPREVDYVALDAVTPDRGCGTAVSPNPPSGFANCAAVWAAGLAPIHAGDWGFDPKFDADGDGVGCERRP